MLLPRMLVGSYAQPEWLIDRAKLAGRFPPRVRAKELCRIPEAYLAIEGARIVRAELAAQ
jgi:5-methyltetrahydropteroyltriglutamate--homocysteine methyltransferase